MKKKKKVDDGRVIANMNIDGMPRSIVRRTAFDEFGVKQEKKSPAQLSKKEFRSVLFGVISSYALYGAIVFGAFALFILFCTKVWFK